MDGFVGGRWMVFQDGIWMVYGWHVDGTWMFFFFSGWYMDGMWMVDGCPFLFLDGICFFSGWYMDARWMVDGWFCGW